VRLVTAYFTGMNKKLAPELLSDNAARIAKNCVFNSGTLKPLRSPTYVWTPTKTGEIKSIFKYKNQYWFHWLDDVDVVESPLPNDPYGRVYWTGEAQPRYTTEYLATTGGDLYPNNFLMLGIPSPDSPPTQTVPSPSDPNNLQSRSYIYTFVSAYGEEGMPSDPSPLFDITDGDSVTVNCPSSPPSGQYNIAAKNIYRRNGDAFMFVAQISATDTEYTDTKLNVELGSEISSTFYDTPPSDMKGLIVLANGCLAGFTKTELCLSEPYLPHAWPSANRMPFEGEICSIKAFGSSILVTTKHGKPYIVTGTVPSLMAREQFEIGHACMSKRGTVDMGYHVVYPSPYGLVLVGTGQASLITSDVIDELEWIDFAHPDTLLGTMYMGKYIGFYTNGSEQGGFIFDPKAKNLSLLDLYATAAYNDPATGELFLVVNNKIVKFDSGDYLQAEWESKPFIFDQAFNFSRCRVYAENFPVSIDLYHDDELFFSKNVSNDKPFTLPLKGLSNKYSYKITTTKEVKRVSFATSILEL